MTKLYANTYILLVAPPGVGKSSILTPLANFMRRAKVLKIAPNDITKASMIDNLVQAETTRPLPHDPAFTYTSMAICASEFGVLLPSHDLSFMNILNDLYDNIEVFRESRRSRGKDSDITLHNPQISLIGGTQPDYLGALLPDEAWGMGFMSRVIMVYHGVATKTKLFGDKQTVNYSSLFDHYIKLTELAGEMRWTDSAMQAVEVWYEDGMQPVPMHSKLKNYLPRRIIHLLKLCLISACSRLATMIDEIDVRRALHWLLQAEQHMPDVFRSVSGNSDMALIQDLDYIIKQYYFKKKVPVHMSRIMSIIAARTPAYNVQRVFDVAVSTRILVRTDKDGKADLSNVQPYFIPGTITASEIE